MPREKSEIRKKVEALGLSWNTFKSRRTRFPGTDDEIIQHIVAKKQHYAEIKLAVAQAGVTKSTIYGRMKRRKITPLEAVNYVPTPRREKPLVKADPPMQYFKPMQDVPFCANLTSNRRWMG